MKTRRPAEFSRAHLRGSQLRIQVERRMRQRRREMAEARGKRRRRMGRW
jgi:hypothetical protein